MSHTRLGSRAPSLALLSLFSALLVGSPLAGCGDDGGDAGGGSGGGGAAGGGSGGGSGAGGGGGAGGGSGGGAGAPDASVDPDGGALPSPTRRYEYFHDGTSIRWVAPHGTGILVPLAGAAPASFLFPEAVVAPDGSVSERRTSVLYVDSGMLYRLDGEAPGDAPPLPARVSSVADIGQVCATGTTIVSDLNARGESRVVFRYAPTGETCLWAPELVKTVSVRLLADAAEEPELVIAGAVPLVGEDGALEAVLTFASGSLVRATSLTDATETGTLVAATGPAGTVISASAFALGAHRFAIWIARSTLAGELYVYDAATSTTSAKLGDLDPNGWFDPAIADDTYVYFAGRPNGAPWNAIYRLPLDGSGAAQKLAGSDAAGSAMPIGVASGMLFYSVPGASGRDVLGVSTSADFASPGTPVTVATGVFEPFALSANRLFFQSGNFGGVVSLDGSDREQTMELSQWIGCTSSEDHVLTRRTRLCDRVLLLVPYSGSAPHAILSFDADAGGATSGGDAGLGLGGFFAHPSRDEIALGALTDYVNAAELAGDVLSSTRYLQPSALITLRYQQKATIPDAYHESIAYAGSATEPDALSVVDGALAEDVVWLSKR